MYVLHRRVIYQFDILRIGVPIGGDGLDSIDIRKPENRSQVPEYDSRETRGAVFAVYWAM